ncbi:MAG: P4 alpha zinc-binding domain-containing protein [Mesorhizobium sp.]|uniref:P4 alpha zinc-binding domain-containing protein n=1 Tax=Mesorhizobium sp. TaxID=1871066 RepID=UPI000FE69DBA|nr:P4 alpha zinc-binding domain-containing protein [Mesorhizobium sp.]RWK61803.1 MAG: P4 alpha zinc-binding domain-containing protein [Mesorhizobium sp.]RWM47678.1 MAG: P4 alpha zinc-binding domain-containing protein [Mesorhizobium sp.]RWN02410.1 MAG: P4 alpha zinc-binding domain-containing protein [Mesorhizobium sp.]
MSEAIKLFIEDARAVSIEDAAKILNLTFKRSGFEHPQPCPNCRGTDTFSFNTKKEKWNCRTGGIGGNDAIGMAAHCEDLDIKSREGLLEACSIVLGRDIPDEGERESDEDREARKKRLKERRLQNEADATTRAASQDDFRERERNKARGIYQSLTALRTAAQMHGRFYLQRRCGGYPDATWLRVGADVTYWHGQDERGSPLALYSGPAMVAPFIMPDLVAIGCHITWIDLDRPPKLRPELVDSSTGELLPAKKMRGSKKGGLIPIAGHPECSRWVGGEGIENGVAFGVWEGFRPDTFYFAAGDLGNLTGPADPSSRFAHPALKKPDAKGVARPVMVAGPVPKADQDADDAMWVADHVDELVLLADGDSERVMTAAAMARARARHARPGRLIPIVWPRAGYDFSSMAAAAVAGDL